ncbi:hypothetical protein LFL97_24655 [Burkholderia sp. JSH-S8]|nr:hypothetical protein LFL97_24655 [Burkholderia sp. JSH-S8]
MARPDINVRQVLLAFARLNDTHQQHFIAQMNGYLLASPQQRKRIVEQWRQPTGPSTAARPTD